MIKELTIEAKAINEIASYGSNGLLSIELSEVDGYFIDNLKTEDIIKSHSNENLLKEMDADEIISYLEDNFSVKVHELK
ncbi:MAG: hypothetical protein GQ570_11950 [Helicobacteraceae bacterium]|nr:hypothetical protein [Helicobacteraceae bacterium]